MRKRMDEASEKYRSEFLAASRLRQRACPAASSGSTSEKYGVIPGVTDRDYYTNSFHVPVYYPIIRV